MNVAEMIKNVNAECHPITDIDSVIIRWLNRGQKVIQSKGPDGGWMWLRQYDYTLTTTSSVEAYALSSLVDTSKIISFRDTSSPRYISNMSESHFQRFEPGPTATGDAFLYRLVGFSPVQNQPTSASTLSFTSSSASDTAVDIRVKGLNGSSVLVEDTVTLNGTNAVTTTNSYTKVLSLSKDAVTVGSVTCKSNAAAVTNVVIAPTNRHLSHPVVKIFNIPDSTDTLKYDFTMKLTDLVVGDDTSLIPEQYHDVIELYAIYRCYKHLNNTTMWQSTYAEFNARIEDMLRDHRQPSGVWALDDYEPSSTIYETQMPSMFPRED